MWPGEPSQTDKHLKRPGKYLTAIVAGVVLAGIAALGVVVAQRTLLAAFLDDHNGAIVALATVALVYLGSAQLRTFRSQERWMRESATQTQQALALGRQEFIASNRPHLILQAARFDFATSPDESKFGTITCALLNTGTSSAAIVGGNIGSVLFASGNSLPPIQHLRTTDNAALVQDPPIVIPGGGQEFVSHDCGAVASLSPITWMARHEPCWSDKSSTGTTMALIGSLVFCAVTTPRLSASSRSTMPNTTTATSNHAMREP